MDGEAEQIFFQEKKMWVVKTSTKHLMPQIETRDEGREEWSGRQSPETHHNWWRKKEKEGARMKASVQMWHNWSHALQRMWTMAWLWRTLKTELKHLSGRHELCSGFNSQHKGTFKVTVLSSDPTFGFILKRNESDNPKIPAYQGC